MCLLEKEKRLFEKERMEYKCSGVGLFGAGGGGGGIDLKAVLFQFWIVI